MEDIKAIDVMNYLFTPERMKQVLREEEIKIMFGTMFKGKPPGIFAGYSAEEIVAQMDEAGFDKIFIPATKMWSWKNHKLIMNDNIEDVYEQIKKFPDRFVGLAGYNPFRIMESVEEIEKAVKECGFKGVYAHLLGFDVAPNDRRMYPCYAKCVELGIPFSLQIGHSLELMPSEVGRPIYLDQVALEFPELTIIGSHTGWPWCEELIAIAWKHPNVYIDISAHLPRYLDQSLITFMDTRGRNKVLFGTNGLGFKLCKDQFLELPLKDETKVKVLRQNAIKVFKL